MSHEGIVTVGTLAAQGFSVPVFIDSRNDAGNEHLISRGRARARATRAGATGTVELKGIDLPNPEFGAINPKDLSEGVNAQMLQGDGVTTVFVTDIDFDSLATQDINYLAILDWKGRSPTILPGAAAASATRVAVADDGSGKAEFTFNTAPTDLQRVAVFKVSPTQLIAAISDGEDTIVDTRDLLYLRSADATVNSTTAKVEALAGLSG